MTETLRFFGVRYPLKFSYIGAEGTFKTFMILVAKMHIVTFYQRVKPLENFGNQNRRGVQSRPPLASPRHATYIYINQIELKDQSTNLAIKIFFQICIYSTECS